MLVRIARPWPMTERVAGAAGIAAVVTFWTALFAFAAAYPGYTHSHKAIQ